MIALGAAVVILASLLFIVFRAQAEERREWAVERNKLLQRIQAPERATLEDFAPTSLAQGTTWDSDEDFWEAKAEVTNGDS